MHPGVEPSFEQAGLFGRRRIAESDTLEFQLEGLVAYRLSERRLNGHACGSGTDPGRAAAAGSACPSERRLEIFRDPQAVEVDLPPADLVVELVGNVTKLIDLAALVGLVVEFAESHEVGGILAAVDLSLAAQEAAVTVSYTHLRAHETPE